MPKLRLPNLFIVGAAKSGTNSLYYYLNEHPDIFMSPVKEPNFFSIEEMKQQGLYYKRTPSNRIEDLGKYSSLFKDVKSEKVIGEKSVSYLFYPSVPEKISKLINNAKIIILLRNPVDRAFSHYLMDSRAGYFDCSFEDIVFKKIKDLKLFSLYYQQVVGLGFYYEQVKRYLDVFSSDYVKIFLLDELKTNPLQVSNSLLEFLGLKNKIPVDLNRKRNPFKMPKDILKYGILNYMYRHESVRIYVKKILPLSIKDRIIEKLFTTKKPQMNKETSIYMKNLYSKDILCLQDLIKRDLSLWLQEDA